MTKEIIVKGMAASKGIAFGKPFLCYSNAPGIDQKKKEKVKPDEEIKEYEDAIENSKNELKKILKLARNKLDERNLLIFEAQLQFLDDKTFHKKIRDRVKKEKKQVSDIFIDEVKQVENRLIKTNDEYLKERIADIEDVKNRVLRRLFNEKLFSKIDPNSIVVSRNLTPGDAILFSNRNLLGFATDLGGPASHVSIIARSMNVPAVVGLHDISLVVKSKDFLIIDGYKGEVIINPELSTIKKYKDQLIKIEALEKELMKIENLPSETLDGQKVKLSVNLEFNKEIDYVVTHSACEVGLYRTEHLFLEKGDFPSFYEQYRQYKMLAERLYPGCVTIRTFDIGGDKILPDSQKETNPFLGWRGIRICLDKPEIFLTQLKAILRASAKRNLKLMFPMITSLDEILRSKELLETAKNDLKKRGFAYDENIEVGIMVEVPSAIFIADSLAKEVKFFSLGTNDLIQYILAVARDSGTISNMYEKFHPSVIRAIKSIIDTAKGNNINVSVCGEMAGDPMAAMLLIGLGVDELSVETVSYLNIKKLIRNVKYTEAKELAEYVLRMNSSEEIKTEIRNSYDKIFTE